MVEESGGVTFFGAAVVWLKDMAREGAHHYPVCCLDSSPHLVNYLNFKASFLDTLQVD